jgi:hypothetical protein
MQRETEGLFSGGIEGQDQATCVQTS